MRNSCLTRRLIVKHVLMIIVFMLLGAPVALNAADLKLSAVFSDHMVLQCDKPVPVWGWGDPGEKVTVEFAGQKKTATADAAGKWMVKLDPLKVNAEPATLVVKSEKPERKVQVADVLVGEVWLGSGQSNMAWPVSGARDFEKEKAESEFPLIRMFKESSASAKTESPDASGNWAVCSAETVGGFSATLFYFGREIHRELKVPVGLINSSVGGTPIESWIAMEAQNSCPQLKTVIEDLAKADAAFDEVKAKADYEKVLARWEEQVAKAKADGKPAPKKPGNPLARRASRGGAGGLFNGKIAPLIPYAIRGSVWYQGESNTRPEKSKLYQYQLPLLVTDWRKRWSDEFPFAWVQLPNFTSKGDGWMLVREAMLKTLRLRQTGMAIAIDIGDPKDIHPKNKQEVGRRLALWALGDVYGQKVAATSGPLFSGYDVKDAEIVVWFDNCEGGLKAKEGELKGFVIAGEDRVWKPGKVRVEGEKVIVSSPDVSKPVAVRYAWADNPECNLYNGAGLPASPFRTDDWAEPFESEKSENKESGK